MPPTKCQSMLCPRPQVRTIECTDGKKFRYCQKCADKIKPVEETDAEMWSEVT